MFICVCVCIYQCVHACHGVSTGGQEDVYIRTVYVSLANAYSNRYQWRVDETIKLINFASN